MSRLAPWQIELSQAVTSLDELYRLLDLSPSTGTESDFPQDYPVCVPRNFIKRMAHGDPGDPLLLQVLPRKEELRTVDGFSDDPVGEFDSLATNRRILKKYPGRALLLTTEGCGIHCRFCFRRHLPKNACRNSFGGNDFDAALESVRNDVTIEEIILSGGDPLLLDDAGLANRVLHYIEEIPHVKRIRIHSRLPVVLPSRMTQELNETLSLSKPVYLVLHVNHPNEIGDDFRECRKRLTSPAILSQTVLLKGVNDNVETLTRLFTTLIDQRIIPYYLHQLDRVQGAAHFEVPEETGLRLMGELRNRLPGYAVPKYVREIAGASGKLVIG